MVQSGKALTVTTFWQVSEQPLASVTVTVIVTEETPLGAVQVMELVVPPDVIVPALRLQL